MKRVWSLITLFPVILVAGCSQSVLPDADRISTLDFGTPQDDGAFAVTAASARHIYVTGITYGRLHGPNDGRQDGFLRRYDSQGDLIWGRQIHSRDTDFANDVAASPSGADAYVVGGTGGSLGGSRGSFDAYIRRYDENGAEIWTRQFGTSDSEAAFSVRTGSAGNIYVAGGTFGSLAGRNRGENDAFVRKYHPNGTVTWTRQFGTPGADIANAVTLDGASAVYVAGNTTGSLDGNTPTGQDAYVRKYTASGALRWTRQIDLGESDNATSLASYSDGVYVVGTYADNNQDVFIHKYDEAGRLVWRRSFGTPDLDGATAIRADSQGDVYVAGDTEGDLSGNNKGACDAFVRKYNSNGTVIWTRQFGASGCDLASSLATRGSDELYVAGGSDVSLDGRPTEGGYDAFLRRLDSHGYPVRTDQ